MPSLSHLLNALIKYYWFQPVTMDFRQQVLSLLYNHLLWFEVICCTLSYGAWFQLINFARRHNMATFSLWSFAWKIHLRGFVSKSVDLPYFFRFFNLPFGKFRVSSGCRAFFCRARGQGFKPCTVPTIRSWKEPMRMCCLCYDICKWLNKGDYS